MRFAVVMYGGVSLAIYINGVVQELFRMVRATAMDDASPLLPYDELSGTECVYRQLGQLLGRDEEEKNRECKPEDPILTSFVVDILSGSSAGGINAVYLAKALANGQDIQQLSQLWTDQGDIGKLINDRESVEEIPGLALQKPPKSLLNGQRMYRKLLDALDEMEQGKPSLTGAQSPYVEKLDLFVTSTDFHGLPVPLRLADKVVEELRHRNVYHLQYGELTDKGVRNDFLADKNPFLAFAARSTSAFPYAFDPMKLGDIDPVLGTAPLYQHLQNVGRNRELWQQFFPAYRQLDSAFHAEEYDFTDRPFVDGGYLDNKPFSYAMDALASRDSRIPVDRKLIYIEPSPEHIQYRGRNRDVPDAIENVAAALSSLPRYEPIREDLQRILYRNRLLDRVETITSKMDEDVRCGKPPEEQLANDENFGKRDLRKMIETEGVAYGGYQRLKVTSVFEEITEMIARTAGFDVESDKYLAIRYLVRAWKEENYAAYKEEGEKEGKATENEFLVQYDLSYRLRRLSFVLGRIDRLYPLNEKAKELLKQRGTDEPPETSAQIEEFRNELSRLRAGLSKAHLFLLRARQKMRFPNPKSRVAAAIRRTNLTSKELRCLLDCPTQESRRKEAKDLVSAPARRAAFDRLAAALARFVGRYTIAAAAHCRKVLAPLPSDGSSQSFAHVANDLIRGYYDSYDRYDLISFPILYGTEVGDEIQPVEVVRISPEDATCLDKGKLKARKLRGIAFRGFGAFLDRRWRQNDILWGRLDGAARITTTLLQASNYSREEQKELKRELIQQAHRAILEEPETQECDRLLANVTSQSNPANDGGPESEEPSAEPVSPTVPQPIQPGSSSAKALLDSLEGGHEDSQKMDPKTAVRVLSRSTRVTGDLLEGIGEEYRTNGERGAFLATPTAWVARLGRVFWGLVEVSVPNSLAQLFFRHGLRLLYLFETLLIVGGTLLANPEVQKFGLLALAITVAIHLGSLLLGDLMLGRRRWLNVRWLKALIVLFVAAIVLLAVLGAYHLFVDQLPEAWRRVSGLWT